MMLITKDFLKNIPVESKERVLKKLDYFAKNILDNKNKIRSMPKGFWIKRIKETEVYKFRLDSSDRILFTFLQDREGQENILLLDFCKHDKQIVRGENLDVNSASNKSYELSIDDSYYSDEEIDNIETNKYVNQSLILDDVTSIAVSDNYISILMDEKNEDYLYYLSNEQFECFKSIGKPIILSGAAGSGKTTVAAQKVFWFYKSNLKIAYFTFTELLKEEAQTIFNKFKEDKGKYEPEFYSLNNFYSSLFNIDSNKIVKYSSFKKWFEENKYRLKGIKKIDTIDIWTEIRGIIKGYIGLEGKYTDNINYNLEKHISLADYLNLPNSYSIFNADERKSIYNVCLEYEKWINISGYSDGNELSIELIKKIQNTEIEKYDYLIIDEVQDLSEIQIYMLSKLVSDSNNIMFCGDVHQIVNPTFFSFGRLKNIYYGQDLDINEYVLNKNYRNTSSIVKLLNKLVEERKRLIGSTGYDYVEKYIREGDSVKFISPNYEQLKELLDYVKDKHYCAVVVANEGEREALSKINCESVGRIFTVNEIKGLEYENIYCINIISSNINYWNEIYEGLGRRNSKYRYYFNQLYVSISRAKSNLFIYEKDAQNTVLQSLRGFIEKTVEINKETLKLLKESTKEDWKHEAEKLEKVDKLEKANFARDMYLEDKIKDLNQGIDDMLTDNYKNTTKIVISECVSEINLLINKGYEFYQQRNYTLALEYFEKALEMDPNYYLTYYCIANTYSYMLGGVENSIKYFDECIRLKEDFYLAYIDKAAILTALKRNNDFINVLNEAISVNSNYSNAYMMLSKYYLSDGIQNKQRYTQKSKKYLRKSNEYAKKAFALDGYVWNKDNMSWEFVKRGSAEDTEYKNIKTLIERSRQEMI